MLAVEVTIALLLCAVAALLLAVLRKLSGTSAIDSVAARLDTLDKALAGGSRDMREEFGRARTESAAAARQLREEVLLQLKSLTESSDTRMEALRRSLDDKMRQLQEDNMRKLEQMRQTVDEKLQGTLEQRLGDSFRLVSERLEAVHKGLGEMHTLASGVGDLKKVLSNVRTRGVWGEAQLGGLLEQILRPGQYDRNVAVKGTSERVEFAVRLPGRDDENSTVWLPIDAKFPQEDYQRLVEASERADVAEVEIAARQLESRLKAEARRIRDKYICPPHTTDFAVLFVPVEGLYAEALRRNGLVETLQREYRVTVAGPTTVCALLNSLQVGFQTLAIQKQSSQVWKLLGAAKAEFLKYAEILKKVRDKLNDAGKAISEAENRARIIEGKLRDVEVLPEPAPTNQMELESFMEQAG